MLQNHIGSKNLKLKKEKKCQNEDKTQSQLVSNIEFNRLLKKDLCQNKYR